MYPAPTTPIRIRLSICPPPAIRHPPSAFRLPSSQATPAARDRPLQGVAQSVERENDEGQRQTREEAEPPGTVEIGLAVAQHLTPGGGGRLDAETEKGERRFEQDCPGGHKCRLYEEGTEAIRQ